MAEMTSPERALGDAVPLTADALFRAHFGDVYRVVGRMLGPGATPDDIEDVCQEVFIAAHHALPSFRGESKPMTWLCGIAYHRVLTFTRSRRRYRRLLEAATVEPTAPPTSAHDEVETREAIGRIWSALLRIKPKKRLVYVLHEVEGLTGAEIAAALAIPEATVHTRLYHARRDLARALARSKGAAR